MIHLVFRPIANQRKMIAGCLLEPAEYLRALFAPVGFSTLHRIGDHDQRSHHRQHKYQPRQIWTNKLPSEFPVAQMSKHLHNQNVDSRRKWSEVVGERPRYREGPDETDDKLNYRQACAAVNP